MPSRESLHELINTLPEAALESTERFSRRGEELTARTGTGVRSFHIGGGSFNPDGDGMASMRTSEGETSVTLEIHLFRGHRLEIEERMLISEDKKSLLYKQQIKGPKGKEGRYEMKFEVA
jgi:hypothetical protein